MGSAQAGLRWGLQSRCSCHLHRCALTVLQDPPGFKLINTCSRERPCCSGLSVPPKTGAGHLSFFPRDHKNANTPLTTFLPLNKNYGFFSKRNGLSVCYSPPARSPQAPKDRVADHRFCGPQRNGARGEGSRSSRTALATGVPGPAQQSEPHLCACCHPLLQKLRRGNTCLHTYMHTYKA